MADPSPRVRFQLALALGEVAPAESAAALAELAGGNAADPWITAAVLSASPAHARRIFGRLQSTGFLTEPAAAGFAAHLIQINAASADAAARSEVIALVAATPRAGFLRALGEGLRRAGTTIEKADTAQQLATAFTQAARTATDAAATTNVRAETIELLGLTPPSQARVALTACLAKGQPDAVQNTAIKALAQHSSADTTRTILEHWPDDGAPARETALHTLVARDDSATELLASIQAGVIPPGELLRTQEPRMRMRECVSIGG